MKPLPGQWNPELEKECCSESCDMLGVGEVASVGILGACSPKSSRTS